MKADVWIAPAAVPSALVSRPTPPINWLARSIDCPLLMRPKSAAMFMTRSNCSDTTARRLSACAARVVPA